MQARGKRRRATRRREIGGGRTKRDSAGDNPRRKIIRGLEIWRCADCPNCPERGEKDSRHRLTMKCLTYGIDIEHPASGPIPMGCGLPKAEKGAAY